MYPLVKFSMDGERYEKFKYEFLYIDFKWGYDHLYFSKLWKRKCLCHAWVVCLLLKDRYLDGKIDRIKYTLPISIWLPNFF